MTALTPFLAGAATTIELADYEPISSDLAEALLEHLAPGCSDLLADDRVTVA